MFIAQHIYLILILKVFKIRQIRTSVIRVVAVPPLVVSRVWPIVIPILIPRIWSVVITRVWPVVVVAIVGVTVVVVSVVPRLVVPPLLEEELANNCLLFVIIIRVIPRTQVTKVRKKPTNVPKKYAKLGGSLLTVIGVIISSVVIVVFPASFVIAVTPAYRGRGD